MAAGTTYFLLGYLLVRGIVSRATRVETEKFLAAVVIVNTVTCVLFLLDQGLNLPVYLGAANANYVYAGQDISRRPSFKPAFNLLALGFVLAKRRWSPAWIAVLAITLAAIMVS